MTDAQVQHGVDSIDRERVAVPHCAASARPYEPYLRVGDPRAIRSQDQARTSRSGKTLAVVPPRATPTARAPYAEQAGARKDGCSVGYGDSLADGACDAHCANLCTREADSEHVHMMLGRARSTTQSLSVDCDARRDATLRSGHQPG